MALRAVYLLSRLFCLLPLPVAMALGHVLGALWYYCVPIRRRLAHRQVARALGPQVPAAERRRIVRQSFVNLVLMVIEGLRYPVLTARRSEAWVARRDIDRLDALLARGRGVIAVSIHLGNFELLGTSQSVRGYPISAIFKDMHAGGAAAFWQAQRRLLGLGQIPPRQAKDTIVERLRAGEVVAFLIDQHLAPHRSLVCSFFGRAAATTHAPVRFALQTGAPIMPLYIVRRGFWGRHEVVVLPEFELERPPGDEAACVAHNTQRLNDLVEGWVRAYPEQWLWAHKRWKVADRLEMPQSRR